MMMMMIVDGTLWPLIRTDRQLSKSIRQKYGQARGRFAADLQQNGAVICATTPCHQIIRIDSDGREAPPNTGVPGFPRALHSVLQVAWGLVILMPAP
jgi:hypothetical protein